MKIYGSPRIHQQLLSLAKQLSRRRVARLMRKEGLQSQIRPKWVATTDSRHTLPVAPNRLDQEFTAGQLGQVWVSDITYIPSTQGWFYLTTIMDLADHQIPGWSLSEDMSGDETIIPVWKEAIRQRPPQEVIKKSSESGQVLNSCKLLLFKGLWEVRLRERSLPLFTA